MCGFLRRLLGYERSIGRRKRSKLSVGFCSSQWDDQHYIAAQLNKKSIPVHVGHATIKPTGIYNDCCLYRMLTHRQSARAKALKRQYNYDYYRCKNGRKDIRQVVQSIPDASDMLPERLLTYANALTTNAAVSEPVNMYADAYGAYVDALKGYFAIEGVLDHNDAGTQTVVLQQRAREVLRAYENMARLTQPGDW